MVTMKMKEDGALKAQDGHCIMGLAIWSALFTTEMTALYAHDLERKEKNPLALPPPKDQDTVFRRRQKKKKENEESSGVQLLKGIAIPHFVGGLNQIHACHRTATKPPRNAEVLSISG